MMVSEDAIKLISTPAMDQSSSPGGERDQYIAPEAGLGGIDFVS